MSEKIRKCCLRFSIIIKPLNEMLSKNYWAEPFNDLVKFNAVALYQWRNENINDIINCLSCSYIIGEFTTVFGNYINLKATNEF
jgi:hypothetical protein